MLPKLTDGRRSACIPPTRGYPNMDRYPNLDTGGIAKKKMLLLA